MDESFFLNIVTLNTSNDPVPFYTEPQVPPPFGTIFTRTAAQSDFIMWFEYDVTLASENASIALRYVDSNDTISIQNIYSINRWFLRYNDNGSFGNFAIYDTPMSALKIVAEVVGETYNIYFNNSIVMTATNSLHATALKTQVGEFTRQSDIEFYTHSSANLQYVLNK